MYGSNRPVHPVYMAKNRRLKVRTIVPAGELPVRWRKTNIRLWRDAADMTLEEAAEALGRPPIEISTTHASLGRIENGKQMPSAGLLEALLLIYRCPDLDSLLNRTPGEAGPIVKIWQSADRKQRKLIEKLAIGVIEPEET